MEKCHKVWKFYLIWELNFFSLISAQAFSSYIYGKKRKKQTLWESSASPCWPKCAGLAVLGNGKQFSLTPLWVNSCCSCCHPEMLSLSFAKRKGGIKGLETLCTSLKCFRSMCTMLCFSSCCWILTGERRKVVSKVRQHEWLHVRILVSLYLTSAVGPQAWWSFLSNS